MAHANGQIEIYKTLLEEYVVASHIAPDLANFIGGIDGVQKVLKKEELNKNGDGVLELLQLLNKYNEPGWFTALVEALNNNDYGIIADHLRGTRKMKNSEVFKALLAAFCKEIIATVHPEDVLLILLQKGTISKQDVDDINQELIRNKPRSAMLVLLLRMTQHANYWISDFIAALNKVGTPAYKDLANQIEPAISKACPENEHEVQDKIHDLQLRQANHAQEASGLNNGESEPSLSTHAWIASENFEYEEDVSNVGPIQGSNRPDPEGQEWTPNIEVGQQAVGRRTCDITSSQININSTSSACSTTNRSRNNEETLVKTYPVDQENPTARHLTSDFNMPLEARNNLLIFGMEKKTTKEKGLTTAANSWSSCQGKSQVSSGLQQTMALESQPDACGIKFEEIQAQPLVLHSYQKELAEPALNGKNVIIVAPTGSDKTHVALYITQNHFQESGGKKVIFFVPTTELVSQQKQMYHTYLSRYKVYGLSGEVQASQKVPISSLIDKYDILVMTPQILLNALQKKDVLSLKMFTLMIFDECHHATKEHPYNNIMAVYLDEKYSENRDYYLPQVVGLTPSVGVGGAHETVEATEHILRLCANLDSTYGVSVVEKCKKELQQFVTLPSERKITTHGREEDPFRDQINNVMSKIEARITDYIAEKNITTLSPLTRVPGQRRGTDQYIQWLSRLHREAAKIRDQKIRRPIYACRAHLTVYNMALMINEDCRTADSLSYLQKEFREINQQHKDVIDIWLEGLFNCHRNELCRISEDSRYYNPKLKELAKILLSKYKSNEDMRAIVFCKTHEMTVALQKWIKETPELAMLNPIHVFGTNISAEKGGVSQHQQDALTYFKDGIHKVIIATSVAEEGLDVKKCNLVIRYEYSTNEIAIVQARGRGRAEDSDYVVLGDHSCGAAQKEEMNRIKQNMMKKAIQVVKGMSDVAREQEIQKLQSKALEQRKIEMSS